MQYVMWCMVIIRWVFSICFSTSNIETMKHDRKGFDFFHCWLTGGAILNFTSSHFRTSFLKGENISWNKNIFKTENFLFKNVFFCIFYFFWVLSGHTHICTKNENKNTAILISFYSLNSWTVVPPKVHFLWYFYPSSRITMPNFERKFNRQVFEKESRWTV